MSNAPFQATLAPQPGLLLDERELDDQLHQAERADWTLLALVGCSAAATLLLAAAISLAR